MRKTLFFVLLLVCVSAFAQQTEVTYSDDFQSYGSPKNPPGWVDTAIGSSKPEASGLFKTWPDPTQGNKATNVVFGSKSSSGNPDGNNPRIGHFSTLTTKTFSASGRFEYRGRFIRTNTDSRIGFTFLSSYPEKDQYYLAGLWSVPGSTSLTMQFHSFGAGTLTGTTNSGFTPATNTWYRFLIQVDDVAGATKIRARFWADGSTEPTTFSIDATDASSTRLTTGRIGIWAAVKGSNYVDDLFAKSPVDHTAPVIKFFEGGVELPPNATTAIDHDARVDVRASDDLSGVASITATALTNGIVQPYTPLTPIAAEGPHVIGARAVDNVGNASTSETTVLVDKTPPVITLTVNWAPLPLPIARFNTVPSIVIAAADQWTGAAFSATLDGQPYASNTPISVQGTHHLVVEAIDGVKNKSIVQATILVDLGAPVIELYEKGVKLTSPAKFKFDPAIEIRLTDEHSTPTYTATLENGSPWKSLDPMPTGWHKITVNSVDEAGNTSSATLDVLVDKDAPVIVLRESGNVLDPSATAKFKRDVAIDVSITDPTSAIASSTTTLNGQPYASGTLITVEQNTHTIAVHAEDEAGNVTDVTLAVLVDKTAPVIAFSESGVKLDERELQKFRRDATIDISVTDAISTATYTATITTPARGTSAPYTSGTPVTVEDTHAILVQAVDEVGNTAEATLTILVDKTSPSIAFSESGNPLDTTQETPFGRDVAIDISVTDNLPGVTYTAKLDGADYTSGTPITTDGPHVVSVHAIDAAENTRDGEVKVLVDKTGPTIAFFESNVELDSTKRNDFNRVPSIEIRVADALSTVTYTAKIGDATYTSGTPVPEGYHTITVRATDARGNVTDAKLDLLVDITPPVVKLKDKQSGNDLPASGAIFARDVDVDADVQDTSQTTVAATLDGNPFSLSVPVSQEGERAVVVTVTDELQWKTTVSSTFIVDKTAPVLTPVVTVTEGTTPLLNGASFAREISINVNSVDITPVQITATIDGQPYTLGQPYATDGTHVLVVNAVDAAGNRSETITLTFYIDKNAPEVTLLESGAPFPLNKTFTRDVVITIDVKAATETTKVATIDDAPYTLGSPYTPEGRHHFKVVVTNIAGLKTTVEADFAIDRTPPTLTLFAKEGTPFTDGMKFGADLTPFVQADDNLTKPPKVVVLLDGAELPPNTVVSEEKFHSISATATDDGGLATSVGPFGFVLDKTAPTVTVKVDGEPLLDGAKFNKAITPVIEADDLTTPVYTITLDGASYARGTAIENDDDHTLEIRVKDDLGNESVLDPIHFTIDKTAPAVTIVEKINDADVPFSGGKFKRPVTPIVRITDLTDTLTNATIVNRTTNEESPWTSGQEISSDGHYTLKVTVTDELGWVTVVPAIDFTIDQAVPVISVTERDVPLVTNTIFNRDAQPKITVTDTTTPSIDAKLNGETFVSETLVTAERQHTLTVKATDELGFVAEILPIVFTVDKTPPAVSVKENGIDFADGVPLDHDAVPQVLASDLTPYTIAAKVDGLPFALGGSVTAEGPHAFDVTVTDSAGWQTTVPTIHFIVDKTAPVVTVTEGKDGPALESGDEFKVTLTPWINVTDITATTIVAKLNGAPWTPNTPIEAEGNYVLEVTVTDAVGRTTVVPPIAFIIDKSAPVVQVLESSAPFVSGTKLNRPAQLSIDIEDLTKTTTAATVGENAFTFPGTVSTDGKHTLSVTVTDNLGQPTVVPPIAFTIDQTKPVVAITESGQPLLSGAAFNRNVKPEITIDDLTPTTTVATLNGAAFTFGTEITVEGQYTLAVEVTDELGWRTVVPAIVFYIDRTPPVVTLKEGENDLTDGLWFNRDVVPRAVITDTTATTTTATLTKDSGTAVPYTLQTPIAEEGKYTLAVTVTDSVGLKTDVPPVSFTIDKTPPAITILYPAAESTLTTAQIVVVGDSDDATSVTVNDIETTIDPAEKKYATKTALELLEGENTLVAFGIDRAGNNTTLTQIVRIDTRAPELSITSPAANACFNTRTVQVTGTVGDPNVASVKVTIAQSTVTPVDATLSADRRTWTATLQFAAEGKFVISASARDNGGHESIANVPVSIDETKPRVEITNAGAAIPPFVSRTVAPFARVVDADLKATLTVTLDGAPYVSGTPIEAEKAEPYELKATATDCAGNKSDETIVRFVIDKTAPQFLALSPANGASIGTSSQVNGNVSPDTVSVVVEGTAFAATVANGAFAFSSLPVADGVNRFTLIAIDRAGNTTRIDYSFQLKTSAPTVEIVENGSPIVSGTKYGRPVTVDIRSNESDATITATRNGQPFTSGTTVTENGSSTISATARDSFGHSSTHEVTFTIDSSGPVVTITEPQEGAAVSTERVRVRGTITGDPVSATINGADLPLTSGAFDVEIALEPGPNEITIVALDASGNSGVASVGVTRGGGSLGLILNSPADNLLTNRRTITVAGQVLSPAGVTHVVVNGTQIPIDAAGAFRKTDFTLEEGQNVITASVSKGEAQGSVTVTVTADFTPPVITVRESGNPLEEEARFATQAVLTVEATDGAQSITPVLLIDAAPATSPVTVTTAGGHTLLATARDAAGNEKRVERTFFIGAGGTGACALSDFDPPNNAVVTLNTVTLVGRTGGAAGVKVNGTAAIVANSSFSATVNLPVEGANTVTIHCTDAAGNTTGTPSTITLTRVTGAPSITIGTPANNSVTADETITVTGTISTDATEVVVNGAAATINGTTFTATNVRLAAGVNVIVARARNAAGRASTDSVRVTWLKNLPTITITSPAAAFMTNTATIDVSGVWTGLDAASLTVTNGAAAATAQTTTTSDTTGTFKAPAVDLLLGANTITVRGLDRLGRAATATIAITRVEAGPSVTITQPADNAYFAANSGETFAVSGSFTGATGAAIEVNGVAATIDATAATFTAAVPFSTLPGGLTPVVARITEPAGASSVDTIRVTKLAPAPTVEQVFPEADTINVSAGALPLVLFSAPMDRVSVRDAFRLENAAGTPVNGEATLDRDVLTFAPAVLLDAGERYTIRVATTAKDLGGNTLADAFSSNFTVAVTAPATAPTLNAYASRACESLDLSGTAPAGARVRIDLGTLSFNTTASSTGAFTFRLPLSGRGGFQVARVRVVGTDGSLSPAAEATFEVDCAGPQVTDASFDRTANVLTITFSKPIDLTTITIGAEGSVRLQLLDGTVVGGTASLSTPSIVAITPAQNLGNSSFTLTVTTAVKDTNGLALSSAYSRAFAIGGDFEPGPGAGYISGEIFDADTGRPLPGATVTIDVPVAAFARPIQSDTRSDEVATTSAVAAVADNRGRYLRALPEGAHTIRASAEGYTTVWRQIIVRAGAGVIPTDIRLTHRGATQNGTGAALVLTDGGVGDKPLSRAAELRIPGGVVASGNHVTLTSLGAQSLPGLLPLGWSPLASAEIVSNATALPGSELTIVVPNDELTASAQTLTAVRYHEDRDEWRVVTAVVAISNGKATVPVDGPGAYALVYPDKAPHLQAPPVPTSGGVLSGVADRCATETCPPLVAKNALELVPPVVLPTQRTVATLRIEGSGTSVFPSGTAVQAYVDEELHLADGTRDVVSPFVTDLLLYRSLSGDTGEAQFHLAPSGRAAEVVLEVGYDHIRILPYPERVDRGALIGPEGGRVPADDRVTVEIPSGATTDALKATAASIQDFASFGTIAGYRIVGGLSLSLQWASQTEGEEATPVELLKPARATFTVNDASLPSQLILVEVVEGTPYGRIFHLASQITALEGGARFSTKTIDRAVLPVDGIVREGTYLLLAPNAPIAFATGTVHLGADGAAVAGARVLTPALGVIDLSRATGIFNVPVPATTFTLVPRTIATGDGAAYNHPTAAVVDQIVNVGALSIVAQPPAVTMTVFSHTDSGLVEVPADGAIGVTPTSSVKAVFTPGLDPLSVALDSIVVIDQKDGTVVPGRAVAQGSTAILWSITPPNRLRVDAKFVAIVSPNVRGSNGAPLGRNVTATFSTVSALSSPDVDPSKIRITIPDENGRSSIIGAPGALKEHWNAVAVRRGRDFSNRPQDDADAERKFRIELGTTGKPEDRVTISDLIDLQIINDAGAVAAILPLGPFATEDGRGFVARPEQETRYTTPDDITLTVPAGAFDEPTVITVEPATKAALADVPGFDEELIFHAGFKVDFEGRAKKRLDIAFPKPASLGDGQSIYLGRRGISSRGPRIQLIDLLRRDGDTLTTDHPETGSAARAAALSASQSIGSNAIVTPNTVRDMLGGFDQGAILIGFGFNTSVTFVSFPNPPVPLEFFIPPIKSMYFASFRVEPGRVLVPVPANVPFNLIGVDPGSGLTVVDAPFGARPPGAPGDFGDVELPSTNEYGPYPVFTTPGRTAIFDIHSDEFTNDKSIRNLLLSFAGSTLTVKNDSPAVPANTHVEIVNLRTGFVTRSDDFAADAAGGIPIGAQVGDRLLFLIGDHDVDPSASVVTIAFSEPIIVGTKDQLRQQFRLLVADIGVTPPNFKPLASFLDITSDSGGRRINVAHMGGFQRGKVYRLTLSRTIKDTDPSALYLGQKAGSGPLPDLSFDFVVRPPKGVMGSFEITSGGVRDLAMSGNILLVSALEGGILAYDASNPAKLKTTPATSTTPASEPQPIATIDPPIGRDGATWALATDDHGRVFATALSPMYGVIRSYRIEDFYCTSGCPKKPLQKGNAIIAWRTGINVGVPLAAMMIGGWPEAIPRKMQILTKDAEPEISTFENDPPPDPTTGVVPGAIGNGYRKISVDVTPTPGLQYDKQRVTVVNVTRNYRWSKDIDASSGSFEIIGKAGDQIKIMRNLGAYAVVSLFGHGIGVYDLNAIDANYRNIGVSGWQRLQDNMVLDTGDGGSCGFNVPCNNAAVVATGEECQINDLVYSPDAGIALFGETIAVFALHQNRGLLQYNIKPLVSPDPEGPNTSCYRPGSLVFQERPNANTGGVWAGHPRLNTLRRLFKAASGRDPVARYTTVAMYHHDNGNTYALVAGNEIGLLVTKVDFTAIQRQSLVDVVWIPGGAYSVRVMQDDDLAVVVDGKRRVLLVNLAQIDESDRVPATVTPCASADCEWDLFPTAKAALSPVPPPAGSPSGTLPTPVPNNSNGVGFDDPRIVWKSPMNLVIGTIPPIVDSETGFVYTGDVLARQMNVVSAVDPKVRFIGYNSANSTAWRELDRIIPLGIEPPKPTPGTPARPAGADAAFQILVSVPGSMTEELASPVIPMAIESERVLGAVTAQTPQFLPRAHLRQTTRLGASDSRPITFTLRHDAPASPEPNLRFQRGWNRMISKWVVAIADPRAAKDYEWGGTLTAQQKADRGCFSCERPPFVTGTLDTDWYELYTAGRVIAVRPEHCASPAPGSGCASTDSVFDGTEYTYLSQMRRLENRVATIIADTVRPTHVLTAAQSAPASVGAHQETFFVHSGEVMSGAVDLDAGGRAGWNVAFDRTYRSRTLGLTPLGAGWDSSNFQRLRLLPTNDVEYRDGSGETWRFKAVTGGQYTSPDGLGLKLVRLGEGWRMTDAKKRITDFDGFGRMSMQADEFYEVSGDKGNVIRYSYDAEGRLSRIVDPVSRTSTLTYDARDQLDKIEDWRKREIVYHVNADGLLTQVELPKTRGLLGYDYSTPSTRPKQDYKYLSTGSSFTERLELGTNLEHIREPGDTEDRVSFEYETSGVKRDMVKTEIWHTLDNAKSTFIYAGLDTDVRVPTETTVTDALEQERKYKFTGPASKNYSDDRVHTYTLTETAVPVWSGAGFGALPAGVTTAMYTNADQQRTWTFEYETDSTLDPAMRGLLKSTKVEGGGASVETTFGWTPAAPGAVLQTRNVTAAAGGLAQSFGYSGANLESVTSEGETVQTPELRRETMSVSSEDGGVKTETTRTEFGMPKTVVSSAVSGGLASGTGVESSIDYHVDPTDSIKHRRGLPMTMKQGGGTIQTDVTYDPDNPDLVTISRTGRNYNTTKEYNEVGRPIRVTVTGEGGVDTEEVFAYDARGRLVRHRKKQDTGRYVEERYAYDLVGRVLEHETYEGATSPSTLLEKTTTTYNLPEQVMRTTLPAGGEVTTTLDRLGRVQDRETDPKNPSYMGVLTTIMDRTRYDIHDNVVFGGNALTASASRYDGVHRVLETLTSGGTRTKTTLDGFGRGKEIEDTTTGFKVKNDFTPGGKLKSTSTNTSETTFTWDGAGRTTQSVSKPGAGLLNAIAKREYDNAGRLLNRSIGEGAADSMTRVFDGTTWNFTSGDLPTSITSRELNGTVGYTHLPTFDALGRATDMTTGGAADMTVEQDFDAIGNAIRVKTPAMPGETNLSYDGRGLVTEEKKPAGSGPGSATNKFEYDASGVLQQYTDPTSEPTKTKNDGLGRPYLREYFDGSTEEIHYDQWRVSKVKDRQNRWQRFVYEDETGRLKQVINSAGDLLDDLTYDAQGRLIRWKTPESLIEFWSFDPENRPQLTRQTRYRADGTTIDDYQQSHLYDGFGRRISWTMPGASALTTGWTTTVQPKYDGTGNVISIDRGVTGGTGSGTLMSAEFRASGRPIHRTLAINPASPLELRREYDYEADAGRLNVFRVLVGAPAGTDVLMAGSEVDYDGTLLKSAKLLGLANGERTTSWAYDNRGRLRASAAASTDPNAAATAAPRTVLPKLKESDFLEEVSVVGASAPAKTFGETAGGHKIAHTGDPSKPFQYKKGDGTDGGALRTQDDHFIYEFDEKERLRKVTQRLLGAGGLLLRVVYSYNGLGRMIGRRVEIADASSGTMPDDDDFVLATPQQLGPDAGLPPETTFVWDPISDQLVAVFDVATGKPFRQFIHGGMGLDDPIEVTVAEGSEVVRYYPIYDEAGDGNLQVILTESGKIVTRTIITDPYGDGEIALSGAAVEKVTIARAAGNGMNVDVEFTEPMDSSTLSAGVRLSSLSSGETTLVTSSATPTVVGDGRVVRWELSDTQWNELATAPGAASLSIAVTNALRSSTYTEGAPVMFANTTLRSGVSATTEVPFELRETFAEIASQLAGPASYDPYTLTTLVGMPAPSSSSTGGPFGIRTNAQADSGALLLLTSTFQAQSFMDPLTLKNYVRARWYDPETGTFLSPDPLGYRDSSNLYAFVGGDPVNGRDPMGMGDGYLGGVLNDDFSINPHALDYYLRMSEISTDEQISRIEDPTLRAFVGELKKLPDTITAALYTRSNPAVGTAIGVGGFSNCMQQSFASRKDQAAALAQDKWDSTISLIAFNDCIGWNKFLRAQIGYDPIAGWISKEQKKIESGEFSAQVFLIGLFAKISSSRSAPQPTNVQPRYVYRVIRADENPEAGIFAKNPNASYKVEGHILHGSRPNFRSQYISTTTDLRVAQEWAARDNARIVQIDLNKVNGRVIDLSTEAGRAQHLKGVTAKAWANSSSEVLIEGSVPPSAVTVID